jgi:hypothetical protein
MFGRLALRLGGSETRKRKNGRGREELKREGFELD